MSPAAVRGNPEPGTPPPRLAAQAVCLDVVLRKPGKRRKVERSPVPPTPGSLPIHVSVDLFDSAEYQAIERLDDRIRALLRSTALPFPMRAGAYLVPQGLRERIERDLSLLFAERTRLRNEFLSQYPALEAAARGTISRLFRSRVFPSRLELEQAFQQESRFSTLQQRMAGLWSETTEEIQRSLRQEFLEMVEGFAASLGETSAGAKRRVMTATVEKIILFLETFKDRNILGDRELAPLVERVRALFAGAGVAGGPEPVTKTLRSDKEARDQTKKELDKVSRTIQDLFRGPPPSSGATGAGGRQRDGRGDPTRPGGTR